MSWDYFVWFAVSASVLWICGAAVSLMARRRLAAAVLTGCGSVIFIAFIAGVWITLGRPPLRTMGETRLWFSLFLSLTGLGVYLRWGYRWTLPFAGLMSVVFVCINIFKPEIHTEELMPALRSPWFVPHVIVYMFAYAVMGVATVLAIRLLWLSSKSARRMPRQVRRLGMSEDLRRCDTLVRIGWGFLTMGMVMGALWAKQAWGDYWTWDPKETWAAATWLSYLLYLHLRQGQSLSASRSLRLSLVLLVFSFLLLQMCWWGVNYLPSARGFSLHTY